MSGPGNHERETDPAAIDELVRAFSGDEDLTPDLTPNDVDHPADRVDDADRGPTQPVEPALPAWVTEAEAAERGEAPPETVLHEQILIVEAAPSDPTPPATKMIRIDDYNGSVAIEDLPRAVDPTPPKHASGASGAGAANIIAIEDADLPDAVYVEGSLDRSGSRSIVFIQDDDTDDALAPESERDIRRGIEPRMRERRRAVKRAQGRRRLKWVLLGVVIV